MPVVRDLTHTGAQQEDMLGARKIAGESRNLILLVVCWKIDHQLVAQTRPIGMGPPCYFYYWRNFPIWSKSTLNVVKAKLLRSIIVVSSESDFTSSMHSELGKPKWKYRSFGSITWINWELLSSIISNIIFSIN